MQQEWMVTYKTLATTLTVIAMMMTLQKKGQREKIFLHGQPQPCQAERAVAPEIARIPRPLTERSRRR